MRSSKSLIYRFLWSYAHQNRSIQLYPSTRSYAWGAESDSNLGISMKYIGPGFLAQQGVLFGVLAQVTKAKPTVRVGRAAKALTVNDVWSHPPGSNRRPADYESAALPTELGWPMLLTIITCSQFRNSNRSATRRRLFHLSPEEIRFAYSYATTYCHARPVLKSSQSLLADSRSRRRRLLLDRISNRVIALQPALVHPG